MTTLGIALMPEHPPRELAALARTAEALGYACLWVPDERFWRDMSVCMTEAVLATSRIRVASAVTDPYSRHPALTAQIFATLDELSGGRVACGIGAGIAGFDALGIRRERPVRAIREAIELMRALWAGGAVDYAGETVRFAGAGLDFAPLRPDIPVYVAGRGPRILSLAGEIADGVMIGSLASEPGLRFAGDRIRRGVERAGRDPESVHRAIWLHTAIDDDEAAAEEAVRTIVTGVLVSSAPVLDDLGIPLPRRVVEAMHGVTYGLNSPGMQRVRGLVGADVIEHFAVAGNPARVRERLAALADAGIEHVAALPWRVPGQSPEAFAAALMEAAAPIL